MKEYLLFISAGEIRNMIYGRVKSFIVWINS